MITEKFMTDLHAEHKVWLNKLSFYKDDLKVLQHRLEEVASKNTAKELMPLLEQLQNQLIIQQEQVDILRHEINEHEDGILKSIKENPVASDHRKLPDHTDMRNRIERFENLFAVLRKDLLGVAARWM